MISHERPKIFDKFEHAFGVKWDDGIVIAWDGQIFSKNEIPPDLLEHEQVHLDQQSALGKEKWLKAYLRDPKARFEFEKEAYLKQVALIKRVVKQKNNLYLCIREVAQDFCSSLYGYELSLDEAMKILYP